MGTPRPRFLLALVLVASLNLLAVFAALPPDGYLDASEPAVEEAYDPRALLQADSDAALESVTDSSVDSIDSVDLEDSEDLRVLLAVADVAANLKQTSDDASGKVKKAIGQAGRNVRNSVGSMMGVPPKKGKKKHHHRHRHRHRGGKKTGTAGAGKRNSGAAPKASAAGKRNSGAAAPKTPAAPAAGAKGVPKKQAGSNPDTASKPSAAPAAGAAAVPKQEAGAKDTSGAAPKAPAAASEPRALLEAADSDAALIDSVDFDSVDSVDFDSVDFDSVDSEDPRVLLTMGDAAADLKQLSDDASGLVKKTLGQAGRNVRNSIGSMMGAPTKGKKKHRHHRHRHHRGKASAAPAAGAKGVGKQQAGSKLNSGAAAKTGALTGAPKRQAGSNLGAAPKPPAAPTVGTAAVRKEQ
ncbi:unnamed protein product [Closterium sp. NIES-53]